MRAGGLQARYLAAADGLHSPIRRALGLERPSRGPRRWGIRRHVQIAPWTDSVEVHWAPGAEAYVTPVAEDCVGIAILSSTRGGFDGHFEEFPELRARVHGHVHGQDRAAGPLRQSARSRTAGRVLLVGDAAGYVDALTGEGMGLAFSAASAAGRRVVAERPEDYDRQWRRATRRYRILTAALVRAGAGTRCGPGSCLPQRLCRAYLRGGQPARVLTGPRGEPPARPSDAPRLGRLWPWHR